MSRKKPGKVDLSQDSGFGGSFGGLGRGFLRRCFLGRSLNNLGSRGRARADRGGNARLVRALGEDLGHAHHGQVLTMALRTLRRMLAAALDEVDRLRALDLVEDLGLHAGIRNERCADGDRVAAQHQNLIELDRVTGIARQFLDLQNVSAGNFILLATSL